MVRNGTREFLKRLLPRSATMNPDNARYSPDGKCVAITYNDPAQVLAPNELRYLGKLAVLEVATRHMKTIADYRDGLRGPICWSPDGKEVLFSRYYLPKGDDREKMEAEYGLAIWAIGNEGTRARFLTTGWSPDWRRDAHESEPSALPVR